MMGDASDEVVVEHDSTAQQFRAGTGTDVAVLQYRRDPGTIAFLHTEVPESFRGQGIAQKLAHTGLEFARKEGLGVIPLCPFVRSYLKRHPEYQSLVKEW